MIGCYVSPSRSLADYEKYLDRVTDCAAACLPCPLIVLGDFNGHSRAWGNTRDNLKGDTVLEWAAGLDLRLVNRGSVSICVRWQGEFVVDLTATPAAMRILSAWPVADSGGRDGSTTRRWCLKRLDKERLEATACVADWPNAEDVLSEPEIRANWFRETLMPIRDVSIPPAGLLKCGAMHWWLAEIAELRKVCFLSRRQ
ncbi:uncharacterized protein [Battus philenor]|uniref:uncharacterized protein n=1 Tax=Battus philenor TaxID=42288 RepID=UPI0035CF967D